MSKQVFVRHRMNFDALAGFLEIARIGNFSRAATNLFRSQPALSLQIRLLEREYGERLFDRESRPTTLTRAGKTLRRYAEKLLSLRAEALEAIAEGKKHPRGILRVGANDATCLYVLPDAIARFRQLYPSVQVSIYRNFSHKLVEKIQGGEVEIAIVSLPQKATCLDVIPIFCAEMKVIVTPGHPLLKKRAVTPKEVSFFPLLLPKIGRTRAMIDEILRPYRKSLQISMELASVEVIKKFVGAGIGISLLPETFAQPEVAAGALKLIPLRGRKLCRELGLVYRRGNHLSLPAKVFIDVVRETVQSQSVSKTALRQVTYGQHEKSEKVASGFPLPSASGTWLPDSPTSIDGSRSSRNLEISQVVTP
jgi:LysR family transcriptional regulator, low CO2-responsive transcriptional regulator